MVTNFVVHTSWATGWQHRKQLYNSKILNVILEKQNSSVICHRVPYVNKGSRDKVQYEKIISGLWGMLVVLKEIKVWSKNVKKFTMYSYDVRVKLEKWVLEDYPKM